MNSRGPNRRATTRKAPRGSTPKTGKRAPAAAKKSSSASAHPTRTSPQQMLPPLRLGFVRGVAPSKWAERWSRVVRDQPLELVPINLDEVEQARSTVDVLLERTPPTSRPDGTLSEPRARHAIHLYDEAVALVLPADHELAKQSKVDLDDLALVTLIDHPDHLSGWPAATPWLDSSWMPSNAEATVQLVETGIGGALLPLPLARHLAGKRTHAVIPVESEQDVSMPGTRIWASWAVDRDAGDVQRLIGIMRGRTARSSR